MLKYRKIVLALRAVKSERLGWVKIFLIFLVKYPRFLKVVSSYLKGRHIHQSKLLLAFNTDKIY